MATIQIDRDVYDDCEKPRTVIPPDRYLMGITSVDFNDANDYFTLHFRTVAPVPDMLGEQRFYLKDKKTGKTDKKTAILFKRAGLAPRVGDAPREALSADPAELTGTTWVVDVENATSERGTLYSRWGPGYADFWPSNHPDVALFMASLSQRTQLRQPAPTTQQARQPVAAVNGADDF